MRRLLQSLTGRYGLLPVILLSLALGASLFANLDTGKTAYAQDQNAVTQQNRAALSQLEGAFTSIANQVLPSVVSITSRQPRRAESDSSDDFFRQFPFPFPDQSPDAPRPPAVATGSGVIVRRDGYVLTNDHVVGGTDQVTVTLKDGREFKGKVFHDPRSDLALVKIEANNLTAARLGNSDQVRVGQWAIALGSPFGLEQTLTVGVISGLQRQEAIQNKFYPNLIQTDASINPGNSGGPLVNINGDVIGINTLIRSGMGGGNIGIGFAIPSNTASYVLNQLITHGRVTRGFLGVSPSNLNPRDAEAYGVKQGAFVQSVEQGSPADKAGIQVEDVIVEVNGKPIAGELDLRETLSATAPGTKIEVVVVRNKNRKTISATVGEFTEEAAASPTPRADTATTLGFSVSAITPQLRERMDLPEGVTGVVVTNVSPNGSAAQAGLAAGMIITRVGNVPVTTVAGLETELAKYKSGDIVRMRVRTAEREAVIRVEIE